jgi:hypothetical protein
MKPTPQLRFVERTVFVTEPARNYYGNGGVISTSIKKMILQQWWEEDVPTANMGFGEIQLKQPTGEWRDVPLEKEA